MDILRSGFGLAHRRLGLIAVDLLWKIIWVVFTVTALSFAALWITSGLQAIEWEDTGIPALNGWIAAALLQEFWNSSRGEIIATIFAALCFSAIVWVFLEAFCRRKMVRDVCHTNHPFNLFLASAVFKNAVLLAAAGFLVVVSWFGAVAVGLVTFIAIIFLLTLFDTLIRADAVDLLGTDLIRVAGLLGILMSFEGMVAVSFVVTLSAGFLNATGQAEVLALLAAAALAAVLLNILHSYLLLVRFSVIAIMRPNVVEV